LLCAILQQTILHEGSLQNIVYPGNRSDMISPAGRDPDVLIMLSLLKASVQLKPRLKVQMLADAPCLYI